MVSVLLVFGAACTFLLILLLIVWNTNSPVPVCVMRTVTKSTTAAITSPWSEKVLYINLDHRTDRLAHMEKIKTSVFPHLERIPAIKHSTGFIGCAMSHIRALQTAIDGNYPYVCILEDDFTILLQPTEFNKTVQDALDFLNDDFDVLMLGMSPIRLRKLNRDKLVRVYAALGMPGYIVNKRYFTRLKQIFDTAISTNQPIDMHTQLVQSKDRWFGFYPAIARQAPGFSDIEHKQTDYAYLELDGAMLTFV